jgi:HSP20 family molecular chaperone IbpA
MTSRASHEEVVAATAETAATMLPQNVPVNAYETPGAFVILAPLPAVTAGDVSVELTDGSVRFWAELRAAGTRAYVIHEWEYGGYERTVDVPSGYGAGVEASLANGQLAIRVLSGAFTGPVQVSPAP